MGRKIYLAGPCDKENRPLMEKVKNFIKDNDFEVYAPFELKIEDAWSKTQEDWSIEVFKHDLAAIQSADAMILISRGRISSAGTSFEQGFAYALHKKIYVIQITDEPTSLMTFSGCTYFLSSCEDNIENDIRWIADRIQNHDSYLYVKKCKTVLT